MSVCTRSRYLILGVHGGQAPHVSSFWYTPPFLESGIPPFIEPEAQNNLDHGGTGRCQCNVEQGYISRPARQPGYWYPHTESPDKPLNHNKSGAAAAIKIPDEAEKEGNEQCVNSISLQVFCGGQDNCAVLRKYP